MIALLSFALAASTVVVSGENDSGVEVIGQAPIMSGDRVQARGRALEDALRKAVEQVAVGMLSPAEFSAKLSQIRLRVAPKAKQYLFSYRVLEEHDDGVQFEIKINAAMDSARLYRDLSPSAVSVANQAKVLSLCLDGNVDSAGRAAVAELFKKRTTENLSLASPCSGAVLRIDVTAESVLRGTNLQAFVATATLKGSGADMTATGAAYGAKADSANVMAVTRATNGIADELSQRAANDLRLHPQGAIALRVLAPLRPSELDLLRRGLESSPGVMRVVPKTLEASGLTLMVYTRLTTAEFQRAIDKISLGLRHLETKRTDGDVVEVQPVELPPPPPTEPN